MKLKKSLLCLFAVLTMSLAFSASASAAQAVGDWTEGGIVTDVTLEEIGQYPIPAEEEEPVGWGEQVEGMIHSMLHTSRASVSLLPGGYYVVDGGVSGTGGDIVENVNRIGLFDENGEQLIPYEAAIIKYLGNHSGESTGRYLAVYYATEQTEDRGKALLFISDGSWIGGNTPGEDDVMFLGYIRFYDLKRRRFVPDLTGTEVNSSCKDLLVLEDSRSGRRSFDEEGQLVAEKLTPGNGYLILRTSPREVYDTSLQLRFTSDLQVEELMSTSGYMKQYLPDQGWQVIDIDGNLVIPDLFDQINEEKYGIIYGKSLDGKYVLVRIDGQLLAESDRTITCLAPGYYFIEKDGRFTVVGYDGVIAENVSRPRSNLQVYDEENGPDARTVVLNTGEYALPFGRGFDLVPGLTTVKSDETKKYGVFNLFTGEQLLPSEYDKIYESGGLICADAGSIRHVYRPHWQYRL